MSVLSQVREAFEALLRRRERPAEAVVEVGEVFKESVDLLAELIVLVQSTGADGASKRAAALEAIGEWYDRLIAPRNIPYVPAVIENTIVDPALRVAVLYVADKAIDGLVAVLNRYDKLGSVAP